MLVQLLVVAAQLQSLPVAAVPATNSSDPPVRVWLNSDGDYRFGDRAKVYAKSAGDGYLVTLLSDVDGRVKVLFPVDPDDDQRIVGGKKYELKGRGGREAFVAADTLGRGTVFAAYSKTPFNFEAFARDGHWNSAALSLKADDVKGDPESQLRSIVERMQREGGRFDYDLAAYVVRPLRYADSRYVDPYWYDFAGPEWWDYRFGPRFGFGWWYVPRHRVEFRPRPIH